MHLDSAGNVSKVGGYALCRYSLLSPTVIQPEMRDIMTAETADNTAARGRSFELAAESP